MKRILVAAMHHESNSFNPIIADAKDFDVAFEATKEGKLYIYDSGDNPTAGSSSDCTGFLRMIMEDERTEMLESPVIFGGIYDPIAAKGVVKNYIKDWGTGGYRSDLALFSSQGVDIVIAEAHVGYTTA